MMLMFDRKKMLNEMGLYQVRPLSTVLIPILTNFSLFENPGVLLWYLIPNNEPSRHDRRCLPLPSSPDTLLP
jgi:hypothetical protein